MGKNPAIFLALISVALFGAHKALAQAQPTDAQILHLLNRASFGPVTGDIAAVRQMGIKDYIEQQLHPEHMPRPINLSDRLARLGTVNASMQELAETYQKPSEEKLTEEQKKELNKQRNTIVEELTEAKILRAVESPAQLQEVMTDFWFNHFNVFAEKGLDKIFISSYERDAIRPYALGKFRDLLGATAHHPAMLFYLDNWQNTDPDSPAAQRAAKNKGKEIGINENYAREIMELHTLGVDGGYTQQDVTTLAHILTGWGLGKGPDWADRAMFQFDPQRHDYHDQMWLKQTIKGGGEDEIEHVLDVLVRSNATARHIGKQLAVYFVSDDPPESLVNKLAGAFHQSNGDIPTVLRTLFESPEFWDPQYTNAKFKPPFRYVISALRAASVVPTGDTRLVQGAINGMGEPLYRCLTPNGYANTNDQWLNSDALLKRINTAKSLSRFLEDGNENTIYGAVGTGNWSANTLATVEQNQGKMRSTLLLSSPEFLYY